MFWSNFNSQFDCIFFLSVHFVIPSSMIIKIFSYFFGDKKEKKYTYQFVNLNIKKIKEKFQQ